MNTNKDSRAHVQMKASRILNAIRSFSAVRGGYRLRDKMLIFLNRILCLTYPLNHQYILKYGRSLIEPSKLIRNFYCRTRYGIFKCARAENIKINKCNNVTAINVACWSESDELRLYEHVFGKSSLDPSLMVNTGRYVIVKAKRLDDILKELNIDKIELIKIGVEGAEVNVLLGMKETLMKNAARKIIFEAVKPENLIRTREILRQFNYVTSPMDEGMYLAEYKSHTLSVSNCEGR